MSLDPLIYIIGDQIPAQEIELLDNDGPLLTPLVLGDSVTARIVDYWGKDKSSVINVDLNAPGTDLAGTIVLSISNAETSQWKPGEGKWHIKVSRQASPSEHITYIDQREVQIIRG
jgi:hypothetical protein